MIRAQVSMVQERPAARYGGGEDRMTEVGEGSGTDAPVPRIGGLVVPRTAQCLAEARTGKVGPNSLLRIIDFFLSVRQYNRALDVLMSARQGTGAAFMRRRLDALVGLNRIEECLSFLNEAARREDVTSDWATIERVRLLSARDRIGEATAAARHAVLKYPDSATASLLLAECYLKAGVDGPAAEALFRAEAIGAPKTRVSAGRAEIETRRAVEELDPEPDDDNAWVELFRRLGRIRGCYHNLPLRDGRTLFDVARRRANSPAVDPDLTRIQWEMIAAALPPLGDLKVLDIGGAEGAFSIAAAKAGAQVVCLEPMGVDVARIGVFTRYFGCEDRVTRLRGGFGDHVLHEHGRFDVILALGVLYHFDNPLHKLLTMLAQTDLLVLEVMAISNPDFSDDDAMDFREVTDRARLSIEWVERCVSRAGFSIERVEAWSEYCARHEKSAGRYLLVCRRDDESPDIE